MSGSSTVTLTIDDEGQTLELLGLFENQTDSPVFHALDPLEEIPCIHGFSETGDCITLDQCHVV